jgi:hypothetical protein
MCGYQGWFRVPDDGTGIGWFHYSTGRTFEPGACAIDLWPDVRELPASDRFPTAFRHPDGTVAEIFSSARPSTVSVHFRWMRDHGIDGVFLQRFAVDTRNPRLRESMDVVLGACRTAAEETGRRWVLMFDLSGLRPGRSEVVIDDWKQLRGTFKLTDPAAAPAYLNHRRKPLVALWGLGFSDRPAMLDDWRRLVRFFKEDPSAGGCTVMLGVPAYWRTLDRDAIADPVLHDVIAMADVVSPWTVGRYNSPDSVDRYVNGTLAADIEWCRERGLDLLPVAFPGFSWHNLSATRGRPAPLDAIPRRGGRFFWSQCRRFREAGARALYVAMFDELDEGTAIFKCRSDPPIGKSPFVSESGLASDHYLWLTGEAGLLFRNVRGAVTDDLPKRSR